MSNFKNVTLLSLLFLLIVFLAINNYANYKKIKEVKHFEKRYCAKWVSTKPSGLISGSFIIYVPCTYKDEDDFKSF